MSATGDLKSFYDRAYGAEGEDAQRLARWRALSAVGKADHVQELAARLGLAPQRVVEVGCGDGALLAELGERRFAPTLAGFEISEQAAAIARSRRLDVNVFDGSRLPAEDVAYDLGVLSHVLEHVPDPAGLLRETARVCRSVILEVPLEANLSARRSAKREGAAEIGHIQSLGRDAVHRLVEGAGLRVAGELLDPLPVAVHLFFADTPTSRLRARAKAAVRRGAFSASPQLALRLFTLHYACACVRPRGAAG
ncbi:MAG: class I SAM-dependent methyltransferase [Thermoleophilaceae bacterium]